MQAKGEKKERESNACEKRVVQCSVELREPYICVLKITIFFKPVEFAAITFMHVWKIARCAHEWLVGWLFGCLADLYFVNVNLEMKISKH